MIDTTIIGLIWRVIAAGLVMLALTWLMLMGATLLLEWSVQNAH